jgi:hypothetical protein
METPDPLLDRVTPVLAAVPGVVAVVLGGSRASGAAHSGSDYDLGLYFRRDAGLDVGGLLEAAKGLVDDPGAAAVTEVGGWGPWIVGGGWLTIAGKKLDLLYRPIESVETSFAIAGTGASAWITSQGIRMASSRRSGWAKSLSAARSATPRPQSPA